MLHAMIGYVEGLNSTVPDCGHVLEWGCPVPFFGNFSDAAIATVGINPSNKEFVDGSGSELDGHDRRLPTLRSLGKVSWSAVETPDLEEIIHACTTYFARTPYDRWFQVLERILAPSMLSLYKPGGGACHLDLVPYATVDKWGNLPATSHRALLEASQRPFGVMLRDSKLEKLVLNGRSVVTEFERIAQVNLSKTPVTTWDLPRSTSQPVRGFAYQGEVERIGQISLGRKVQVLGYNHNLQSSYGVTATVISSIGAWLASIIRGETRAAWGSR
jgi:hypothetical protein